RNLSLASADVLADPNSRAGGFLAAGQAEWYRLTVPANARLPVKATATSGTLVPRLTLAGPGGQEVGQSDTATVQYLPPGGSAPWMAALPGAGVYKLTTDYVQASPPFGQASAIGLAADLNNDGIPDLVGNRTVQLGNGDGTFGPPLSNAVVGGLSVYVA